MVERSTSTGRRGGKKMTKSVKRERDRRGEKKVRKYKRKEEVAGNLVKIDSKSQPSAGPFISKYNNK